MNLSRARRRWAAWDRYVARCVKISGVRHVAQPGAIRAVDEQIRWVNAKQNRIAKADARLVVGAVLWEAMR